MSLFHLRRLRHRSHPDITDVAFTLVPSFPPHPAR
jgi:hypothetical protein